MSFRDWLKTEMETRDVSRRELARRLAANHPQGVTPGTVETYRSAVKRYLAGSQKPLPSTREAIADALGVDRDQLPEDEDEEEDLETVLLRACQKSGVRSEKLATWIAFGIRNGVFSELYGEEVAA